MTTNRDHLSSYDRERASVFHSWSAQNSITPFMVAGGEGSFVIGEDGERYLDFSSQLVNTNLGHQHPAIIDAIVRQAQELATIAPQHGVRARYEAAEMILDRSFEGAAKVFFTNGGTEAVEHAVRMARLHTGRPKVLSTYRSYHGSTATSINLTGDHRRWATDTASAGIVHFFGPFLYRSEFFAETEEQECQRALEHLEHTIQFEGPNTIAAIILETVPGTAGIMVPPAGYLPGVRALCDKYGIVYIADEVMAGFGRTGAWFAFQNFGVTPDLVTFAKGVNSGYVPLGGVIINEAIAKTFGDRVYPGGLTYSGHPLACAAAVGSMTFMSEAKVIEHARTLGDEIIRPELLAMQERHPSLGDVRGLGVMFALELVTDRVTKEPLAPYGASSPAMNEVLAAARAEKLLIFANYHRLHVVPPCNISPEDLRDGLARLDRVLSVADKFYVGTK